jgi:polysaccharide pyruvyl transferase WcaK-like protein
MARTSKRSRPLLCGYYGEHNLGDDALLEVLLQELPGGCAPQVTAHDQRWVRDRFQVDTCDRRRPLAVLSALASRDALVLGGGSLLQDATSVPSLLYYCLLILAARLGGKPVLLWGQGLGPLRRPFSRALVRAVLPLAQAISWRPIHQLDPSGWGPYLQALATLADRSGRELLWLPFHRRQDRGLLARLDQANLVPALVRQRSRELEVESPSEAMACFAEAGLVLAMRLHGLILAALAGSPLAALSYDPKVAAVARALGCPLHDLDDAPPAQLEDQWFDQLDRPPSAGPIEALREGTAVHRQLLERLLGG